MKRSCFALQFMKACEYIDYFRSQQFARRIFIIKFVHIRYILL